MRFQGDGVGNLTAFNDDPDGCENAAMGRVEKMLGAQELADPVEDLIVDQDGSEERLFRFIIMRRLPIGQLAANRRDLVVQRRFHLHLPLNWSQDP